MTCCLWVCLTTARPELRWVQFHLVHPPRVSVFILHEDISAIDALRQSFIFVVFRCLVPHFFLWFSICDHVFLGCHFRLVPPGKCMNGSYACELERLHQFLLKVQSLATGWPDFLVRIEELWRIGRDDKSFYPYAALRRPLKHCFFMYNRETFKIIGFFLVNPFLPPLHTRPHTRSLRWRQEPVQQLSVSCLRSSRDTTKSVCVHVRMREVLSMKLGLLSAPLTEATKVLFLCWRYL